MLSADLFNPSKFSLLHFSNHRSCRHSSPAPSLLFRHSLPFRRLRHLGHLRLSSNPNSEKDSHVRQLEIVVDDFVETGCSDLPVELCLTRTLDPALTLRHAVDAMKEALNRLKLDPPCSRSGVLRFQIVVPPCVESLNWLSMQDKDLVAFPQFYLATKEIHKQFHGHTIMTQMLGASGVGSAITFRGSSDGLRAYNLMQRYLSFESPLIRTYGFIGIDPNMKPNLTDNQPGSFYFFIPQIEVNEFENFSFLASNLIWDCSLSCTLEDAVNSLEISLHQINVHVSSASTNIMDMWSCFEGQLNMNDKDNFRMVYMNAETLCKFHAKMKISSSEQLTVSGKSYFRHSTMVIFSKNMFSLPRKTSRLKECTNINLLWASLIVEECVRLGLTYFCIAPGSRSSPLALSACSHSLTTCASCYDERSLAFHALGYARGSRKPAVVITSSGTAVSNLFPAVVEASQDFVPLLLLTADRPPELQDSGANQVIDQVNHFGKFVRFFYNFPPPNDQIPARMVLTTIDSAVYCATQSPCGPVHINCPFREPLEDVPKEWDVDCLRGLNLWMSKEEPFTQYIKIQHAWSHFNDQIIKVLDVMHSANQGLLLLGAIQSEDEIWAALILAKHLSWPIAADVLSGLRLRKLLTSRQGVEDDFLFLDYLDHILLSESAKSWLQPDVVVQIGSRTTSKRVGQLLASCSPFSYIFVDKHPYRHDTSHLITHRIQCDVVEFANIMLTMKFPKQAGKWSCFLRELNMLVAMEISFQICSESLLTEPYVAHAIGEVLKSDTALFIGNSMAIRDMDMYGKGWLRSSISSVHLETSCNLAFLGMLVSGNRGASGIDGLLSSSIGFAVGSKKRVVCVIGDVSFLHDTNGLAILSNRTRSKPMTIIVINNHGGAIFSLLPIAVRTQPSMLNQYFYTSHDISIGNLCKAHRVKHLLVQTKMELQLALQESQQDHNDCVIEVESCITDNAKFHSIISKSSGQAADQACRALLGFPTSQNVFDCLSVCKIWKMEFSLYRIQLCAPPTSTLIKHDRKDFYQEGFVLAITLDDNIVGYGEIAPIEIHKEDLLDVEEQLRFLVHVMEGAELSCLLPLLRGSFSHWIWKTLGLPPSSIFPSVRCGMEMAILNALAARQGSSLSDFIGFQSSLLGSQKVIDKNICKEAGIPICALVDCHGTPKLEAHVVSRLFHEGFTTVKLKVARREDPTDDAAVVSEVREMLGYQINIRVDANRKWTYDKAVQFGSCVKNFALEYIEEPVCYESDIIKFCEETGLPVALDETIYNVNREALQMLEKFVHPGIVAIVIKPSIVGGFENAALIAKWAQMHDKMTIVSSAFESSLGLSAYVNFAHYLERSNKAISEIRKIKQNAISAHGLGTFQWLKEDVSTEALRICIPPHGRTVEASIGDAEIFLRLFQLNHEVIQRIYRGEQVRSYKSEVNCKGLSYSFKLLEAGGNIDLQSNVIIFLHGFLGSCEDWIPLMKALSTTARCISIDLPGHGESCIQGHKNKLMRECYQSIESVAEMLLKLISDITNGRVTLVGYSMGGRIALYMSLTYSEKIDGAVLISGSPGLKDEKTRRIRYSQDEARASYLLSHGLHSFLEIWYEGNLWKSLKDHPLFSKIVSNREKHQDIKSLAKALTDLSIGRQRPLWDDLKWSKKALLLIVGERDIKFTRIAEEMCREIKSSSNGEVNNEGDLCEMVIVPECGHAVHVENPLPVINAVRKFFTSVNRK